MKTTILIAVIIVNLIQTKLTAATIALLQGPNIMSTGNLITLNNPIEAWSAYEFFGQNGRDAMFHFKNSTGRSYFFLFAGSASTILNTGDEYYPTQESMPSPLSAINLTLGSPYEDPWTSPQGYFKVLSYINDGTGMLTEAAIDGWIQEGNNANSRVNMSIRWNSDVPISLPEPTTLTFAIIGLTPLLRRRRS